MRFMLSKSICWLQFVGFVTTSGSLVDKEASPKKDVSSSPIANNSSPGNDTSPGKDFVESILDDSGLSNADKNLIGSIVAYAIAFGALSILFCCFLFQWRDIRPVSVAPHRIDVGSVRSKAGFQGLLQSERMRILRQIFRPIVWSGSDEKKEEKTEPAIKSESNITGEDIQVHTATATANHENDSLTTLGDTNDELVCSICLNAYQRNCHIMTGKLCSHNFHYDCGMHWLAKHDECPYCRREFMTDQQFRQAAMQVLGVSRVRALSGPSSIQPNEDVTNRNTSADIDQGGPIDSPQPLPGNSIATGSDQGEVGVRSDDQVSIELGRVAPSEGGTLDMEIGTSESQQEIAQATSSS